MDAHRFDNLTRQMAVHTNRRLLFRRVAPGLAGLTVIGLAFAPDRTDARKCGKRKKRCQGRCIRRNRCCQDGDCGPGRYCCRGDCLDAGACCESTCLPECLCRRSVEGEEFCIANELVACEQCASSGDCVPTYHCFPADCKDVTAVCRQVVPCAP